ncbi:delta-class carbonic anhydrase [Pseudohongiella spirulinae]|uniref:delta-class carbonic anhydrase n=1 Tax=Pseudohongiella spirulinae TaxID=1249552 RepID=UPI0007179DA1|nr:delta-class carbonic anhydrase [Pseudohongiella spirulinae]
MHLLKLAVAAAAGLSVTGTLYADDTPQHVPDSVIEQQRHSLAANTDGLGFGPQSPRDLTQTAGNNLRVFSKALDPAQMNLCNIHFHKNAEHRGGEFTSYAGNGDGHGHNTGFVYNGTLTAAQLQATSAQICPTEHGSLMPGDTIEAHYVFSSAQINPGPTLGACLSDATMNPQLHVEGQVFVLVNDRSALDFNELAAHDVKSGYHQPLNMLTNTGTPIQYTGSTTGPSYNEQASPLQVSWSVRPNVAYVDIETVGEWCNDNTFDEAGAHGVRNLVINPDLLSPIH